MARKKTDVMKWMDEVLNSDSDLAKAVDQRLDEMRREQDLSLIHISEPTRPY